MTNKEASIREFGKICYEKGESLELIRDKINDNYKTNFNIELITRWKNIDKWEIKEQEAPQPREFIKNKALKNIIDITNLFKEQLLADFESGKKVKGADFLAFIQANKEVIRLNDEVVIGSNNKTQLAIIVQNYNNQQGN